MKRIPKITQENVHIFIPYKVAAIARRLNKDKNMPLNRAVAEFYNSVTYAMLEKEDTNRDVNQYRYHTNAAILP